MKRLYKKAGTLNEKSVRTKLLNKNLPRAYKLIMLTSEDDSFEKLTKKIFEIEKYIKTDSSEYFLKKLHNEKSVDKDFIAKKNYKDETSITCFKCGKQGHKKWNCPEKECGKDMDKKGFMAENKHYDSMKKIRINNLEFYFMFDTGASSNFINIQILRLLKSEKKIVRLEKTQTYKMMNNTELKINYTILLEFQYKNTFYEEKFCIIEEGYNGVIIGRELINKINSEKRDILIQCE